MFEQATRQNGHQGAPQRFGDDDQLWSSEPSQDSLEKMQRLGNLLSMRLGPEYLSTRQGPGGSKLTYLEGWRAISLANEVFGHNGWSSSVKDISIDFLDYNEEAGRWSVHVTALVRITLPDGCYHEDVGCGKMDNCKSKADALDKVKKEAVTDAMKRALRNFGNLMGNCIYDKTFLADISKVKAPGKVPLDFSTLHRPGQTYDIDGKIIPAGIKAELNKAPVAGPSNAIQGEVPNPVAQQSNKLQQYNNNQNPQQKPAPQQRQHVQVQKLQLPVQQAHRQQVNQTNQPAMQPTMNRVPQNVVVPKAQYQQTTSHQQPQGNTSLANPANLNVAIDLHKSLDSEDIYDGMEDDEGTLQQEEVINEKYDDSGFDEGNIAVQVQSVVSPDQQILPMQNARSAPHQTGQGRPAPPQNQSLQNRRPPRTANQEGQAGSSGMPPPNGPNRFQQFHQNHQVPLKQEQPILNPQTSHAQHNQMTRAVTVQDQQRNDGNQQHKYAETQPVRSQTIRRASGQQQNQGQGSSPLNQLRTAQPQIRPDEAGFTVPANGMAVPESVTFKGSTRGVKRQLPMENENIPDNNSAINPVVQQAQQGQQGIQRAMSPSERARLAEQQAQQQQMIAQNRQAAMEKRQRLNGRSSGGQKPVSA